MQVHAALATVPPRLVVKPQHATPAHHPCILVVPRMHTPRSYTSRIQNSRPPRRSSVGRRRPTMITCSQTTQRKTPHEKVWHFFHAEVSTKDFSEMCKRYARVCGRSQPRPLSGSAAQQLSSLLQPHTLIARATSRAALRMSPARDQNQSPQPRARCPLRSKSRHPRHTAPPPHSRAPSRVAHHVPRRSAHS